MKINKKFFEHITGYLSKEKIDSESKVFKNIFDIINKLHPNDNKIDIEEITKFAASIWQEDDSDGKISNKEIESYINKNQADFKDKNIKAKDIKKFLQFFIKNSDKDSDNIRIDNDDGSYSIITKREDFEEEQVVANQKEIDEWNAANNSNNKTDSEKNNFNKKQNEEIGFAINKQETQTKESNKKPEPIYETKLVSLGMIKRKVNYNSNNQITSVEETKGNTTTISDADGNLLQAIIENEGAKDTIKDYSTLEDGTLEESIFYGKNGEKDSEIPAYKNVYKNNSLVSRYELDEHGQIKQRQNFQNGTICSVTTFNNGVEDKTVQLFTNTDSYNDPSNVFDDIVDSAKQNWTGDCWLLDGLSKLNKTTWGREALKEVISVDEETGNITIKLKHAYGDTKEFTITPRELAEAQQAKIQKYWFDLDEGDKIYIDGKLELTMPKSGIRVFDVESVKDNITFVEKDGNEIIWTKEELIKEMELGADRVVEGLKYSSNDLTVLACELAVERSRQEVGLPLDGGAYQEVIAMFTNIDNMQMYTNQSLVDKHNKSTIKTNSDKQIEKRISEEIKKLAQHIKGGIDVKKVNSQEMLKELRQIMQNTSKYSCELLLTHDEGYHTGQLLRFEQKDGKDYIVYTHSWDDKAEISEELTHFVNNTLATIRIVEQDEDDQIEISSDTQIGVFQMGNKSNRTNFASAIAMLGQKPDFKLDIEREGDNYVCSIKDEKIIITPGELETARVSGRYSTNDDDIPLLEIAVERYINKTRHNNTLYDLSHTNLEDVKIQDILNLFSDNELKPSQSRSLAEASKKDGLKFAIKQKFDDSIDEMRNTYYPIKEIKQTPDGKYLISVIQPEDTSIVVTYTEEEYKRMFNIIETYN